MFCMLEWSLHYTCMLLSQTLIHDQLPTAVILICVILRRGSLDLSLTSQVDFMTTQMSEMQREVDDKQKMDTALKAAEQARKAVRPKTCKTLQQMPVLQCARMQAEVHSPKNVGSFVARDQSKAPV